MKPLFVIPAQAGIPLSFCAIRGRQQDPSLRWGDGLREPS